MTFPPCILFVTLSKWPRAFLVSGTISTDRVQGKEVVAGINQMGSESDRSRP
jgi:hypothetical protein